MKEGQTGPVAFDLHLQSAHTSLAGHTTRYSVALITCDHCHVVVLPPCGPSLRTGVWSIQGINQSTNPSCHPIECLHHGQAWAKSEEIHVYVPSNDDIAVNGNMLAPLLVHRRLGSVPLHNMPALVVPTTSYEYEYSHMTPSTFPILSHQLGTHHVTEARIDKAPDTRGKSSLHNGRTDQTDQ